MRAGLTRWWRSKTLRARLTLLMVAVFMVVSTTASLVTVVALRVEYSSSVDSQLSTLANGVLDAMKEGDQRLPVADRWLLQADSLYVGRFHGSFKSTGAEPELPDPLPDRPIYETVYSADGSTGPYRLYSEPARDGEVIVVATSMAGLKHAGSVVGIIVTLEALAAIGVMALLGSYLVRRELRPLDQVADQADALAATDEVLPDRLDVPEYPRSTEIGRMVGALDGMLAELRVALAERDASAARLRQFAADASHELRTPLQSIRGYAELRTAGVMTDAEVDGAMKRIAAEVARMTGLVEALLALARFDAELDQDAYRVPVDLSALVGQACRDAAAVQPDRPMRLDVRPGIRVSGEPDQLEQLLANLTGNVRMHTPPDTPMEVTLRAEGAAALLTVRDHGPGIPAEALPQVFDRFFRVDKGRSRAAGGSGLGLAIVAATVAAHQGTVGIAAPEDGGPGVEITVRLPLAE
ncbi:MAG TPA: HAMP domain-containing sensor histidine kinase [Actinospica sp.]|jgi:two-component system OmpR family sensor kinase|nr:HAMP domain-containing sensor histidine kinase [Actinospica sp.]